MYTSLLPSGLKGVLMSPTGRVQGLHISLIRIRLKITGPRPQQCEEG